MTRFLAASVCLALLATVPAQAQPSNPPQQTASKRMTAPTGVTKPPGSTFNRASTEAAMLKAQKVSAARDKAWDRKMRTTMGSICLGC
ncbi:hypothetical protein [Methylobacterium marchantiae]|uniref:Uncharacterized protein n=1 Tax=Methylobacterium marchantiae TaxID=600331 RepID=A0ABW3WVR3_9HYPH|nr:hypothetical protein AIGOOFII_0372 [Methylobacterium marchantiae]